MYFKWILDKLRLFIIHIDWDTDRFDKIKIIELPAKKNGKIKNRAKWCIFRIHQRYFDGRELEKLSRVSHISNNLTAIHDDWLDLSYVRVLNIPLESIAKKSRAIDFCMRNIHNGNGWRERECVDSQLMVERRSNQWLLFLL